MAPGESGAAAGEAYSAAEREAIYRAIRERRDMRHFAGGHVEPAVLERLLDPIGLAGGLHLQRYAPNPSSWIDPWGLATVDATFEIDGQVFTGANPTERNPRTSGKTLPGLGYPNNDRFTMHAEIDAMMKAHDAGIRGGTGKLTVEGLPVCNFCKRSLKNMAQHLDLDSFEIHEKSTGKVFKFNKKDLMKIRQGGKGFKGC